MSLKILLFKDKNKILLNIINSVLLLIFLFRAQKLLCMDFQILDSLLKFPKKKLIKKLFQHCIAINYEEKSVSQNFSTPIIQSLQSEVELSSIEVHKLLLALTNLLKIATLVNFNEERLMNILKDRIQQQLTELVVSILISFADDIRLKQLNRVRQGKKLDIDSMEWNLSMQISNQKGKSNTPIIEVKLPLSDYSQNKTQHIKFQMKGQQFEVFFSNLTKIKQTLSGLASEV